MFDDQSLTRILRKQTRAILVCPRKWRETDRPLRRTISLFLEIKFRSTSSNIVQHVGQTSATCSIQQCWKMLHQTCCIRLAGSNIVLTSTSSNISFVLRCEQQCCIRLATVFNFVEHAHAY